MNGCHVGAKPSFSQRMAHSGQEPGMKRSDHNSDDKSNLKIGSRDACGNEISNTKYLSPSQDVTPTCVICTAIVKRTPKRRDCYS